LSISPILTSHWLPFVFFLTLRAKPEDTLDLCRILNDHIHQLVLKHPRRFIGLATIPMQHSEFAVEELRRVMALGTFAGVQIATHINDMALSDKRLYSIFQACEELNAAVFIHPWDMVGQDIMKKYWLPWLVGMPAETSFAICSFIFGGIFEKLPALRVCFAHGGGSFPGTIGRIEHGFHARPDLVAVDNQRNPREYLKKFWVDSLVHDPVALQHLIELFGHSQITLGSDYPFPLGELQPGNLVLSMNTLSDQEKAEILWKNALKFLGPAWEAKEEFFLGKTDVSPYKTGQNDEKNNEATTSPSTAEAELVAMEAALQNGLQIRDNDKESTTSNSSSSNNINNNTASSA
jgi:aminocarboxymuconate-semialdehyde decarboxylase